MECSTHGICLPQESFERKAKLHLKKRVASILKSLSALKIEYLIFTN